MKHSKQRDLIYHTICEHPIHPTAEEVFLLVRESMPSIGIATVYRNLSSLSERNLIRRIPNETGIDHYDGDLHEHPHFHCMTCKRVYDYPTNHFEAMKKLLIQNQEFLVIDMTITVSGLCNYCQKEHTVV